MSIIRIKIHMFLEGIFKASLSVIYDVLFLSWRICSAYSNNVQLNEPSGPRFFVFVLF